MMRFHLDENVDHAVAGGLRQRGIDVTTANDAGLTQASDEAHLEYCLRENARYLHPRSGLPTTASSWP